MQKNLLLALGLGLLLSACGGGAPPLPGSITLTVEDPGGSFDAAAYQVGTGPWQSLGMSSGSTRTGTFSLNGNTKYGVAVRCSGLVVHVIQATASELPNPKLFCSAPSYSGTLNVTVNIDNSLLPAGLVCAKADLTSSSVCASAANSVSLTLNTLPTGSRDLLVTLKDSGGAVTVAKVVKNVSVPGSTTVNLLPADQLSPISFTPPTPPMGYTSGADLIFYLNGNKNVFDLVSAPPSSYRSVSGASSDPGHLYAYDGNASAGAGFVATYQFWSTTPPALSYPGPWNTGSLSVQPNAHPTISGLSRSESDLRSYRIEYNIPAQIYYTAVLSKGWLGTTTSYTLPDLSASTLLGYTLPSGSGSILVEANFSNKPVLSLNPTDLSPWAAGDHFRQAWAAGSITVGGPNLNLP